MNGAHIDTRDRATGAPGGPHRNTPPAERGGETGIERETGITAAETETETDMAETDTAAETGTIETEITAAETGTGTMAAETDIGAATETERETETGQDTPQAIDHGIDHGKDGIATTVIRGRFRGKNSQQKAPPPCGVPTAEVTRETP